MIDQRVREERARHTSQPAAAVPDAFSSYNAARDRAVASGASSFTWNGNTYEAHQWTNGVNVWKRVGGSPKKSKKSKGSRPSSPSARPKKVVSIVKHIVETQDLEKVTMRTIKAALAAEGFGSDTYDKAWLKDTIKKMLLKRSIPPRPHGVSKKEWDEYIKTNWTGTKFV